MNNRLIKSNDAGGGGCTNTVDLYNPFPDGGGVALYQLNGDATDVSGNYDGTASNVTYGAGQFGQAGVFNGSSSYIDGTLDTIRTQSDDNFSISVWVNLAVAPTSGEDYIYSNMASSASRLIYLKVNTNRTVGLQCQNGTNVSLSTSTTALTIGTWYHIVGTYSTSSGSNIYVNGTSEDTDPYIALDRINHSAASIGKFALGTSSFFDGSIDQVRIFNRALRPYEVEALYTEEYCTPTIVPSEHFNTVIYTGDSSSSNSITGVGFQPDLVWIKERTSTSGHQIADSVRTAGYIIGSDSTGAEFYATNRINSFDTDGFTVGSSGGVNANTDDYVAWNFKAGGAAVTNTDGTITSQVSANTEAGFSVVKYFSNFSSSNSASVGHGLTQAPQIIISKGLDTTSNWRIRTNTITGSPYDFLEFDTGSIGQLSSSDGTLNMPTDTKFDVNWNSSIGASGNTIAYCFAEVEGFSSFGSYVGNGSASGQPIITGFEPAFVMIKASTYPNETNYRSWTIYDNKRNITENRTTDPLYANRSYAEGARGDGSSGAGVLDFEFLSNGFRSLNNGLETNTSGVTYIYMAFAADPTAVEPSLEDSFNTVLYTGDGSSSNAITGVGFQPDLLWIKSRTTTTSQFLVDSIRGANEVLFPNLTNAETFTSVDITSLNTDGFSLGTGASVNQSSQNYVAWNWKGAEIPAINSNGSIPSVVSANPAAGFSIVSWTSTSTTSTIGHGLESTPSIIIMKSRTNTGDWQVYSSAIGATQKLLLNGTNAATSSGVWGNTSPNENLFTSAFNNVGNVIAYCFAEVAGFSKFGSYVGTGAAGNAQDCGFEPAFVMLKSSSNAGNWRMWDNKRSTSDPRNRVIIANGSDSEFYPDVSINFTSTGFSFNTSGSNDSGQTFIYMAFANQF